jgi:type II secretory pathway component PulF
VQFSKTLGMLIESGVNLAEALDIVCKIVDNEVLTQKLLEARDSIIKEGKIAKYLKKTGIFPSIASYMISTGEESGQLAEMLLTVGQDYDTELTEITEGLTGKITPIMTVVMAIIILFIIMAIFLPVMQMGDVMGV